MTSYCSLTFLGVFLPAAVAAYALSPRRLRPWALLAASPSLGFSTIIFGSNLMPVVSVTSIFAGFFYFQKT